MVTVIDYGAGNIGSLVKIFEKIGATVTVAETAEQVAAAERIVLPGVGHFARAMETLRERGLVDALNERVRNDRVPFLGICLGMQLMARHSEEGDAPGLGWIDADCVRFDISGKDDTLKVPNMGWRHIAPPDGHPLFPPLDRPWRFYFVHSYHMKVTDPGEVLATSDHGGAFTAAVAKDNMLGVQFHPEKSHRFGMTFLERFLEFEGQ